jgi:uncharacterized protein with NAD-binding domain and iron-sulfur cluster
MEVSSGIQFFLSDLPPTRTPQCRPGIATSHLQSEWSFVTVVQGAGFWRDVELPPGTKYVWSATWSAANVPGKVTGKTIPQCTPDEIFAECLAQCRFDGSTIIGWQLDKERRYIPEDEYQRQKAGLPPHLAHEPYDGSRWIDFTPLTILLPGANECSPQVQTETPNLFLGGEAVYSPGLTMHVPTMEKAASSGYMAARGIAKACGGEYAERINLPREELLPFAFLRHFDHWRWTRRRPQPLKLSNA